MVVGEGAEGVGGGVEVDVGVVGDALGGGGFDVGEGHAVGEGREGDGGGGWGDGGFGGGGDCGGIDGAEVCGWGWLLDGREEVVGRWELVLCVVWEGRRVMAYLWVMSSLSCRMGGWVRRPMLHPVGAISTAEETYSR